MTSVHSLTLIGVFIFCRSVLFCFYCFDISAAPSLRLKPAETQEDEASKEEEEEEQAEEEGGRETTPNEWLRE